MSNCTRTAANLGVPRRAPLRLKRKLSHNELALLAGQLAAVAQRGLPLHRGLHAIASDEGRGRFRQACDGLAADLTSGKLLSESLEGRLDSFPVAWPAMVRAGEVSGEIPAILRDLAEHHVALGQVRSRLLRELIYPTTLSVLYIAMVCAIFLPTVSRFESIYLEMQIELPGLTHFLLGIADINWTPVVIGALLFIGTGAVAVGVACRYRAFHLAWDSFVLRLPLVGHARRYSALCRFCRTLGLLLKRELDLYGAVHMAAESAGSAVLSRAASDISRRIELGHEMGDVLHDHAIFPYLLISKIELAQHRGDLPSGLIRAADMFEKRTRETIFLVLGLIPGVAILLSTLMAGLTAIALFMPMVKLMGSLS